MKPESKNKFAYRTSTIYDIRMDADYKPTDFDSLAVACKALSHPARLEILHTLARRGACICGEIVDVMPLSQATVSQHLKILKNAGLITGEVDGPRSCYCINTETMRDLRKRFGQLFGSLENCC
jgi:DNA-binding transcriptional ArsR family regulator